MPFFTVLALIKAGVPELWPVAARRREEEEEEEEKEEKDGKGLLHY